MKDFLEQTIDPGDWIVYPNSRSPVVMNLAQVIEVRVDSIRVSRSDDIIKTLRRTDRVTVITEQMKNNAKL